MRTDRGSWLVNWQPATSASLCASYRQPKPPCLKTCSLFGVGKHAFCPAACEPRPEGALLLLFGGGCVCVYAHGGVDSSERLKSKICKCEGVWSNTATPKLSLRLWLFDSTSSC
eukprot:363433-Chlamydomonas_euryale.AAC.20